MKIVFCKRQINTLRPRQNGRYFSDDVLKCIPLNEHVWISLNISLTFISNVLIISIPALDQVIWRQAIIWTNDGLSYWRKNGWRGLNELMPS